MRRGEYKKSEVLSGLFVTLAVAAFGLFAFRVGSFDVLSAMRGPSVRCATEFDDVKSLAQGAAVSVAGRRVGEVTALRITPRPLDETRRDELVAFMGAEELPGLRAGMTRQVVEVDFEIYDGELRLDPRTARVSLVQAGLLGQYFLGLDPGYWEGERAPALEEHTDVLHIASREGPGMDAVLARLAPAIEQLGGLMEVLETELLSAENIDELGRVLQELSGGMRGVRLALDRDDPDGVHATVVQPLGALIENADDTLTVLRKRVLEELLVKAEALVDDGAVLVANVDRVTADVGGLVQDVGPRAIELVDELDATARELSSAIELTRSILAENRPEAAESLRRLRRTMWEAEMAMRKIRANPAYLVFGDDETLLDADEVDSGALERSGRARPYEQRDEGEDGN